MHYPILILCVFTIQQVFCTHIVGAEIYYDCLGNNQYNVTIKVYRDCSANNSNNTPFDNPAAIGIYDGNGNLVATENVTYQSVTNLPAVINDPCLQAPAGICVEEALYTFTRTFTPNATGYYIVYQRCCRNPGIINIQNSSIYGTTIYAFIPPQNVISCNSSPRFNALPPLVICALSNFAFNHSATDPDGDSLVYSFYTPMHGGDPGNPMPNPPVAPPYNTNLIAWANGYNTNNQIPGSPNLTINAQTGLLSGVPGIIGLYVYGIKVTEYRNGVLITEVYREFQTTVTNCPSVVVSSIPQQTNFCTGLTVNLSNNSQNAVTYFWDFGDPATLADTSTLFAPTYSYNDTGTYTIMLIANPGLSCADTDYVNYTVQLPLNPVFISNSPQCVTNNSFQFALTGNFSTNAQISWNFGGATPNVSGLQNPQNINYPDSGYYIVTVNVNDFGCTGTYTDTVVVFPVPQIGFSYPLQAGCEPYTVQFTDTSLSWSTIFYYWSFGDGNFSTEQNPVHTYLWNGVYDVSLTIQVDSVCAVTQTLNLPQLIVVHPTPVAAIYATPAEQSAFTPYFSIYNQSQGQTQHTFFWSDSLFSENETEEISFTYSGYHTVGIIAINDFGCIDTAYTSVYIIPETTLYVPNAFTPNTDGKNDVFKPIVRDVLRYEFLIFDRWGQLVFKTENTEAGWNGKRNGKPCPIDVYIYQINYAGLDGIDKVVRGHFTLIK